MYSTTSCPIIAHHFLPAFEIFWDDCAQAHIKTKDHGWTDSVMGGLHILGSKQPTFASFEGGGETEFASSKTKD